MKTLPVHIALFSNEYAMKTMGAFTLLQQNGVVNPLSKQSLLFIALLKAPIASLNAIVINSLLTKECEALSNVSVFGVHSENGSFSKRNVFNFMRFH